MKLSVRSYRYDTAALLTPVLKGMQAIIRKTCSILNTINTKHTTLVMQLVIPITIIITLTHDLILKNSGRSSLFSSEVSYSIIKKRLFKTLIHDILEQITLETLRMSHLAENLAVAADDTLDSIV